MSEEKTSNLGLLGYIIGICIIVIGVQVGIVLFGSWFEADKSVLKDTAKAQEDIGNALFLAFNDFGRLEVRYDYSVRVYISKKSYMLVPYPDRDKAISTVGRAWCDNESVNFLYMPKVVLRDIQTGEDLSTYRCLLGWLSRGGRLHPVSP